MELARIAPPARMLAGLMITRRDHLSKTDAIIVAAIETGVPALAAARDLVERFHRMTRARDPDALATWVTDSGDGLLASLVRAL